MRFDKRTMSRESERTRAFVADVALSTGGETSVPVWRADADSMAQRISLLPRAAFTRHDTNYWVFALAVYTAAGVKDRTIPNSTLSLTDYGLAVGRPLVGPSHGRLDFLVQRGESIWVVVSEEGTASDVDVRVQVDVTRG